MLYGVATEVEMKEKKDRVDDALHATRAAVEEGTVPEWHRPHPHRLEARSWKARTWTKPQASIVLRAIEPLRRSSPTPAERARWSNAVREGEGDFGYNARTEVFENLRGRHRPDQGHPWLGKRGVDLGHGLTTECVITDIPEEHRARWPTDGGGMGGMMDVANIPNIRNRISSGVRFFRTSNFRTGGNCTMSIWVDNVQKCFGTQLALNGVELPLREVVGLLGPNGAGKSTDAFGHGVFAPSAGRVEVCGFDVADTPLKPKNGWAICLSTIHCTKRCTSRSTCCLWLGCTRCPIERPGWRKSSARSG